MLLKARGDTDSHRTSNGATPTPFLHLHTKPPEREIKTRRRTQLWKLNPLNPDGGVSVVAVEQERYRERDNKEREMRKCHINSNENGLGTMG